MPNDTYTRLVVSGRKDSIDKMKKFVLPEDVLNEDNEMTGKTNFSFNRIIPMPKELMKTTSPPKIVGDNEYEAAFDEAEKTNVKMPGFGSYPITKKLQRRYLTQFGFDNWYDWKIFNWGTKWNCYSIGDWEEVEEDKWEYLLGEGCPTTISGATITFQTAWSPCSKVIVALSKQFPDLIFNLFFADEGGYYVGNQIFGNGELLEDNDFEWQSSEGKYIRKFVNYFREDEE